MAHAGQGPSVWFAGDLDDPWVAAIAGALPTSARRFDCPGDLHFPADGPGPPDVLVLHRAVLTRYDAERLARLRAARDPSTRVVLCLGPYARHADVVRWAPLVDAVVPEATARETVARHLGPDPFGPPCPPASAASPPTPRKSGRRVAVVSTNSALRQTLAEAVEAAGYAVASARDWQDAPGSGPAVWDVPVLEDGWDAELERRTRRGPVIALLGFADRRLVTLAAEAGAFACLELPFDLVDLTGALDRLPSITIAQPPHSTPPPPAGRRAPGVSRPDADARVAGADGDA